jgi:hypothetical protein
VPKKVLSVLGWGLAGLAVALGLTVGAFALAGQEIADPATATVPSVGVSTPPDVTPETPKPSRSDGATRSPDDDRSGDDGGGTPSHSVDPTPSDNGSDDHGGSDDGDDSSGPGSGDDDSSGSGSGDDHDSSGSGSGSDDDDHDDD